MSSEMSDRELGLLLRSLPEAPAPPMAKLYLPPRPPIAPPLPAWVLWCVGTGAALSLALGGVISWWLLHGGIGAVIGDVAALFAQSVPGLARGLGFGDAALGGILIALALSPLRFYAAPRRR